MFHSLCHYLKKIMIIDMSYLIFISQNAHCDIVKDNNNSLFKNKFNKNLKQSLQLITSHDFSLFYQEFYLDSPCRPNHYSHRCSYSLSAEFCVAF